MNVVNSSSRYQVLNMVEDTVIGFRFWGSSSSKSENAYLKKFEGLMKVLSSVFINVRKITHKKRRQQKKSANVLFIS
ncbi:hypothetical protein EDC94DRAFT_622022 [Helicostylum pulchrum]|nr:hypothetical protein EDC94DRAFT_622022 [Helicostylum pulchrum]